MNSPDMTTQYSIPGFDTKKKKPNLFNGYSRVVPLVFEEWGMTVCFLCQKPDLFRVCTTVQVKKRISEMQLNLIQFNIKFYIKGSGHYW